MAPLKPTKNDQRLQAVIESGRKALRLLKARSAIPPSLLTELESHSRQTLSSLPGATITVKSQVLDSLGTEIWNASSCMLHDDDDAPRDPRIRPPHGVQVSVTLRIFAMVLLDASNQASTRRSRDQGQRVRLFKVTIRAARLCLDHGQLELAVTALERCSHYLPAAPATPDLLEISKTDEVQVNKHEAGLKVLEREYYLLRVLHAWKSERLDLADHFYQSMSKVRIPDCTESVALYVKIADLCYEIGKAQSRMKDISSAVKWSERGFASLDGCDLEAFGQEASELRLSIAVSLVEQLLASDQEVYHHRARDVVDQLDLVHGLDNRIALPILRFRVLAHERQFDPDQISDTLHRLVRLAVLTEDNFTVVLQTLRKAEQLAIDPALLALKTFICDRLLPEVKAAQAREPQVIEWLEKATVLYILFSTASKGSSLYTRAPALYNLLDRINEPGCVRFSTKATHAAQTLLWKATGGPDESAPMTCCKILQHPLFEHAGHINKARIGRRLMRIAIKQDNVPAAREAFFTMPGAAQNDPATAHLAFKVALRSDDQELATSTLRTMVKHTGRDPAFLYASVLDAQQSKMKVMAIASLRAVIDQKPPGVQLTTLLRCTARLLIAEIDPPGQDLNVVGQEVVSTFEMAAQSIEDIRNLPEDQMRTEILWWSKNAYNLTLRFCPSVHPELTCRMMSVCLKFLDCIPKDGGLMHEIELTKRKMLCHFLSTTAMIIMGRSNEESKEYVLQCFLQARDNISTFKVLASTLSTEDEDEDTTERTFAMLKYDLECILKLQRWEALPMAIQSCIEAPHTGRWDTLADLIIILHSKLGPSTLPDANQSSIAELITTLLQKIINETWKKDKDIIKVSRWLRFTFGLCLQQHQTDGEDSFSLKLLQQAASMAEKGDRGKQSEYPDAELRWLATTGFNHAVDLISDGKFEIATKWIEVSLEVARWAQDNGQLHKMLTDASDAAKERIAGATKINAG